MSTKNSYKYYKPYPYKAPVHLQVGGPTTTHSPQPPSPATEVGQVAANSGKDTLVRLLLPPHSTLPPALGRWNPKHPAVLSERTPIISHHLAAGLGAQKQTHRHMIWVTETKQGDRELSGNDPLEEKR